MSKIRTKTLKTQIIVNVKLSKSEQLNNREIALFSSTLLRGFLCPVPEDSKTINYIGFKGYPLSQFIKEGINSNTYFLIIEQILEAIKNVERYNLNLSNLVLNKDYIFINAATKELSFIYQPIVGAVSEAAYSQALELVWNIIFLSLFKAGEDLVEVSSFIHALNEVSPVSLEKIEKTLYNTYPLACLQVENQNSHPDSVRSNSSGGHTDRLDNNPRERYLDESKAVFEKTSDIGEQSGYRTNTPYLVRKKNNEVIPINKPVFRLGKEKSYVDYFVFDNNAVSRSHADFIEKADRFFILDLNSTNKTYINGMAANPYTEVQLIDNTNIRLGDEEFTFHIR